MKNISPGAYFRNFTVDCVRLGKIRRRSCKHLAVQPETEGDSTCSFCKQKRSWMMKNCQRINNNLEDQLKTREGERWEREQYTRTAPHRSPQSPLYFSSLFSLRTAPHYLEHLEQAKLPPSRRCANGDIICRKFRYGITKTWKLTFIGG